MLRLLAAMRMKESKNEKHKKDYNNIFFSCYVELVNNSLAFGVSLDAVRDYGVKFKEIAIGADGVIDIQMATFGGQEEGVPGPNASLILLGKDSLEDEFEELGTVNVDSQGGFSFDNDDTPTGFYKLKLKYAPILE